MTNPSMAAPEKKLTPEARRALDEATERRQKQLTQDTKSLPPEKAGPKGAEPTRFGDWERGGIAYDF